jgi:hypothetical protein
VLAKIVLENANDTSKINSWKLNKQKICELFNEHKLNGDMSVAPSKESSYNELLGCYNIVGIDSRRFFTRDDKKVMYEKLAVGTNRGKRICPYCNKEFSFDEFEIDHIQAWSKGGRTALNNAQLLCKKCNTVKGAR